MAPVVIADAGPLIALAKADLLNLLQQLFGRVHLPPAVQQECTAKDNADARKITQAIASSVLVVEIIAAEDCPPLPRSLGEGEKQAIGLALRYEKPLLIMDDRLARKQARKYRIDFIGTARLLALAEKKGHLPSTEEAIETMRANGYRISLDLLTEIRRTGV